MLNSTAAARKQIVATTPATTGRASPSSGSSAGGKGSDGADERLMGSLLTMTAKHFCAYSYMCNVSLSRNWPVLDTPTTLLLSLIRSSMTAITRNSYQDSCERKTKHTLFFDHVTALNVQKALCDCVLKYMVRVYLIILLFIIVCTIKRELLFAAVLLFFFSKLSTNYLLLIFNPP